MPKMIISVDGVVIGQVALAKDRTTLGRRAYNDIVIDNLAVSGEHAVLHMSGGEVEIEDLNSTNGTYVNALAIQKQALKDNDVIEVGRLPHPFPPRAARCPSAPARSARPSAEYPSGSMPLSSAPTESGALVELGIPVLRVLSGANEGQDVSRCRRSSPPSASPVLRWPWSRAAGRATWLRADRRQRHAQRPAARRRGRRAAGGRRARAGWRHAMQFVRI